MKYIALPTNEPRRLSFYLAMEEYVARNLNEPDCFFMWQVEPSVIYGRNQVVENEVNLAYCREHGIHVYHRKSGGGCVYADMDNLMLSMITDGDNVNDIMIGDKKVCGTAFYQLPGRSIVHSTMLYDTNMEHMLNAITPGPEKLEKKGIQSVRQRITFLKDHTTLSLDEIKTLIRQTLCDGEVMLTNQQIKDIEQIESLKYNN